MPKLKTDQLPRARKAGRHMARSIVENINLMYQNDSAANYYVGLMEVLEKDIERRSNKHYQLLKYKKMSKKEKEHYAIKDAGL